VWSPRAAWRAQILTVRAVPHLAGDARFHAQFGSPSVWVVRVMGAPRICARCVVAARGMARADPELARRSSACAQILNSRAGFSACAPASRLARGAASRARGLRLRAAAPVLARDARERVPGGWLFDGAKSGPGAVDTRAAFASQAARYSE
jgi:hypothetical protein